MSNNTKLYLFESHKYIHMYVQTDTHIGKEKFPHKNFCIIIEKKHLFSLQWLFQFEYIVSPWYTKETSSTHLLSAETGRRQPSYQPLCFSPIGLW